MATTEELKAGLELALTWASRGFTVFPVGISWDEAKGHTNKRPLNGGRGHLDATTDVGQITEWFRVARHREGEVLGVGLVPGSAGCIVLDCDRHSNDGVGFADITGIPKGWLVDTASGGEHRYFRKPPGTFYSNQTPPTWRNLIDIRADQGWVVAPGVKTPWGSWTAQGEWVVPPTLPKGVVSALSEAIQSGATRDSGFRSRFDHRHYEKLDILTQEAVDVMVDKYHVHSLVFDSGGVNTPYILFTRDGKREGVSGTIGYTAPGEVYVFSSSMGLPTHRVLSVGELKGGSWTDGIIGPPKSPPNDGEPREQVGRLIVRRASSIRPRPVRWLWEGRIATGTLGLLAGREGTGKSNVAYWMAAQITLGLLPGVHHGTPRSVLVVATEDSWEHVVVPRLMANNADLDRIIRVEVQKVDMEGDEETGELLLPRDIAETGELIAKHDIAMVLLDPLISRLSSSLDSHRDGEVRQALEPLTRMLANTQAAALGIMHFNKGGGGDILNSVMASKAFTSVARSVHAVVHHPAEEGVRIFGTVKNNLGPVETLPRAQFAIEGVGIPDEHGELLPTSRVKWDGQFEGSMSQAVEASNTDGSSLTAIKDAVEFLKEYLVEHRTARGWVPALEIKKAAQHHDITSTTLQHARERLNLETRRTRSFPSTTEWRLRGSDIFEGLVKDD